MGREHTCHAVNCGAHCPPEHLMCLKHWLMVPRNLQREVCRHYRPGQCDDMQFTGSWLVAAERAIVAVALKEGAITQVQAQAVLAKAMDRAACIDADIQGEYSKWVKQSRKPRIK